MLRKQISPKFVLHNQKLSTQNGDLLLKHSPSSRVSEPLRLVVIYRTEFTLLINLRIFKYTAKTVAPFFKLKGQMSIPDLLSITVDATFGNQA